MLFRSDVTIRNCRFSQSRGSVNNDPHLGVIVGDNFGDLKVENNRFKLLYPKTYAPVKVVRPTERKNVIEKGSEVK